MRRPVLILVLAIAVCLHGAAAAFARQPPPPPSPNPNPAWPCGGCPDDDRALAQIKDEVSALDDRLDNIRSNQAELGRGMARDAGRFAQHASDLAAGKPGAAGELSKASARIQDAAAQLRRLQSAAERTAKERSAKQDEANQLRQRQAECRQACPEAHSAKGSSTGPPATVTAPSTPTCQQCPQLATDLKAEQDALNVLQEELTGKLLHMAALALEVRGSRSEIPGATDAQLREIGDSARSAGDEMTRLDGETTRLQGEISRRTAAIEAAREALEKCDKACAPVPISRSYLKPMTFVAGGVAATSALLLGGDGAPTPTPTSVIAAPPAPPVQSTPTPPATPAPPPVAPAPPVTPAVGSPAGVQSIRSCVCENNTAAMDADLLFCQRVAQLLVASAVMGTMRVAGVDPVLPGEGPFNTETGAFDFSATGHVGGVGTVTLRFAGTIDAGGNISATITYTRNGRTTIYRISTMRQ